MDPPTRWLRISYWTGAIVDAGAALMMLSPRLFGWGMGVDGFAPGADYRHAMGMGAALMLGWTALLLWADRRPVERRGVLVLTVAVIAGLAANELRSVWTGFLPVGRVAAVWALQATLVMLFLGSHAAASRPARQRC